jgi:hypothetical protein
LLIRKNTHEADSRVRSMTFVYINLHRQKPPK